MKIAFIASILLALIIVGILGYVMFFAEKPPDQIISYYNERDLDFAKSIASGYPLYARVEKNKIRQIKQKEGVQGNGNGFIFFEIKIESVLYFALYIEEGNSLKLIKIPASDTTIFEDSADQNAYLVIIRPYVTDQGGTPTHEPYYRLHIPENSITPKIDMGL